MTERSVIDDEYSVDLHSDVKMLAELVTDLDNDVRALKDGYGSVLELESDLIALRIIMKARQDLATVERDLENVLAKRMPERDMVFEDAGAVEKSKRKSRTKWDREALLPDVLDSRVFDKYSGELIDETPLDKVLQVWNLGAPRITALRDRGFDPDQYCETEDAGWSIRFHD